MSGNKDSSSKNLDSGKQDRKGKNNPPLFNNREEGVTAWIEEDRNGDYFLRLSLPLGLGSVPIFFNDSGYGEIKEDFNELVEECLDD